MKRICASSWTITKNHCVMHGQQNVRDWKCLLRGSDWISRTVQVNTVFRGLNYVCQIHLYQINWQRLDAHPNMRILQTKLSKINIFYSFKFLIDLLHVPVPHATPDCYQLQLWISLINYSVVTGSQLVKKFPAFYGTQMFIAAFRRARKVAAQVRGFLCEHFITWYVLGWGIFSTSPNPQAGGPPRFFRPRLLIQYIHSYLPYWIPFLHLQPEDAPCRGDRDPLNQHYTRTNHQLWPLHRDAD